MELRRCCFFIMLVLLLLVLPVSALSPIYLAKGEPVNIPFTHPAGTCWYFQDNGGESGTYGPEYYDIPSISNGSASFCSITKTMSASMIPGTYSVVYTYPVEVNGKFLKDISYRNDSFYSVLSSNSPMDESGKNPSMIREDLLSIVTKDNIDGIENAIVVIQRPDFVITGMGPYGRWTRITGTTNLNGGDDITIKIDELDRFAIGDSQNFTFYTKVIRPEISQSGFWYADMALPIQDMFPGWHNASVYAGDMKAEVRFPIYLWGLSPPPPTEPINYFGNGSIKPDVVTVTITIPVPVDRWHTATPTPEITDALGGKIDYPYSGGGTIPAWAGIGSLIVIAAIVLLRDWKWNGR